MKHDPSTYIGIGKDGFLPPENHAPFNPKHSQLSDLSIPIKGSDGLKSTSVIFGGAILVLVITLLVYLF